MAIVVEQIRLTVTLLDGTILDLSQAQDFTTAFVETKDLDMNQAELYKFLESLILKLQGRVEATNLQLFVKYRDRLEDPLQSFGPINIGGDDLPIHLLNLIPSAVYYRFRFVDANIVNRWLFQGFSVFGEADGELL